MPIRLIKAALITTAAFLIVTSFAWAGPEDDVDRFFWARVVQVKDGDTITVVRRNDNLDMVTVRLFGVDAPESDQPYGKQATRALTRLIHKKIVLVEIKKKADRYGRVVGVVKHEGNDVGRELLESGWAWVDPRFSKQDRLGRGYWASVRRAEKAKIGLWGDDDPLPPWKWRGRGEDE